MEEEQRKAKAKAKEITITKRPPIVYSKQIGCFKIVNEFNKRLNQKVNSYLGS
jgi:hypothetical protein